MPADQLFAQASMMASMIRPQTSSQQTHVEIIGPALIAAATGMGSVNLPLDEEEAMSGGARFRQLIDDNQGPKEFTLAFSQDAQGRWFPHFFDEENVPVETSNPITRTPITYRATITIRKVGNRYEQQL